MHIGAACRDVAPDDPQGWRLGGGVTYAALTTARLGLRTAAVVGVDAVARSASELDLLRIAGVDIMIVPLELGPIYHNVERPTGRVQTCVQPSEPLPIPPLPESWLAAPAWSVAPVAGEVRDDWAEAIPADAYVGVAWQGFLRNLDAGKHVTRKPPRPSPILRRADLVGVSHHDVDPSTPIEALTALLAPGALLAVTQGYEGGILVAVGEDGHPGSELRYHATATDGEVDPTGAGDTFLAALVSTAVRRTLPGRSRGRLDLAFAAAAGSLVVEGPGLLGVPDRGQVLVRMARQRLAQLVAPTDATRVDSYDD
ncbi:MAG TPA: PfkB family carbohydrate kinase [Candidatus Dormibacteraeota bacterium]|nr:PfkB family carbohydrate kinase [Candidatus Dormibacteraeota bacterium]